MTTTTTGRTHAAQRHDTAAHLLRLMDWEDGQRDSPAYPCGLTEAQRRAREAFDLEACMASLPKDAPTAEASYRGAAGVRLRPHLVADISDALLREFARETLGAKRTSEQYLDALRVVLGNQAEAERMGYMLELNRRVPFAPQKVMRTIISQMRDAGLTFGKLVSLGEGRTQVVQCFASRPSVHPSDEAELESMRRRVEAEDDARRDAALACGETRAGEADPSPWGIDEADPSPWGIDEADVPY